MTASAQELLNRHGISYVANKTGKFTTACPNCGNEGYLNVVIDRDGVKWFCHHCDEGGGANFDEKKFERSNDIGAPVAVYDYNDENGKLVFQSLRFEPIGQPKQFLLRKSPDQKKWSISGVKLVPYRLPELLEAIATEQPVFIAEGEKDCDTLAKHRVVATTNPMGAGKWRDEFNVHFHNANVVLCGDNDAPGRDHIDKVARSLYASGQPSRLRVLDLSQVWRGMQPSEDVSDYLKTHNIEQFWIEVNALRDWVPPVNGNGSAERVSTPAKKPILSNAEFLNDFKPPDYLIEGMLQRRFIYTLTGQTGHAKTAVALLVARLIGCADRNARLKNHEVEKGRVVYFVGENPDDVRMRLIGANTQRTDDWQQDNIWFIEGQFKIPEMMEVLADDFRKRGEVSLIIVDTSAAYFLGRDEIDNKEIGDHARMLRQLTTLPGGPCVLVLCHPIKVVTETSQLLPRGGSAFLAEVDGNLTLWRKQDDMVELFYNKMRGAGFQAITFALETIRSKNLKDTKGRILPTVQAVVISDSEEVKREEKTADDDDRVLTAMNINPHGSLATWAEWLGWVSETGDPYKVKVLRICERLSKPPTEKPFPTKRKRNRWVLTEDGIKRAELAALDFRRKEEAETANKSQGAMF